MIPALRSLLFPARHLERLCRQGQAPPAICRYLAARQTAAPLSAPWKPLRLVVFDTETTGLDPRKDRMLSIGAVSIVQGSIQVGDSLELMVNNSSRQDRKAIEVHGIVPSETREGQPEAAAVEAFLDYLGSDVLVGHHVGFDIAMIERAAQRMAPGFRLYNPRIDTAQLLRRMEGGSPVHQPGSMQGYNLDALCERYHIAKNDRHTAWGDAFLTAQLLLRALYFMRDKDRRLLRDLTGG